MIVSSCNNFDCSKNHNKFTKKSLESGAPRPVEVEKEYRMQLHLWALNDMGWSDTPDPLLLFVVRLCRVGDEPVFPFWTFRDRTIGLETFSRVGSVVIPAEAGRSQLYCARIYPSAVTQALDLPTRYFSNRWSEKIEKIRSLMFRGFPDESRNRDRNPTILQNSARDIAL